MIARQLSPRLTLIRTGRFPGLYPTRALPHWAVLGIGGNIGDVVRRFEHLLVFLRRDPFINVLSASPLLKNPPFGYTSENPNRHIAADLRR